MENTTEPQSNCISDLIMPYRLRLDKIMNTLIFLNNSAEVTLAKRSLQMGFSWLGEVLKAAGSQTPYVESKNPASDKIEPTAQHVPDNYYGLPEGMDKTQTAYVKNLRAIISEYIQDFEPMMKDILETYIPEEDRGYSNVLACAIISWKHVIDAKIWLGWELGRIRDVKLASGMAYCPPIEPLPL